MVSIFSSPGKSYFVRTELSQAAPFHSSPCPALCGTEPKLCCLRTNPDRGHEESSAVHGCCLPGTGAPSAICSESSELTLHLLALISGSKVNWDNSEFTPLSLRGWFKNTCNVSLKIISFDWKYLEMFLSTGFKRCHFFMNAETLINKIPKALTQLSQLQLFFSYYDS